MKRVYWYIGGAILLVVVLWWALKSSEESENVGDRLDPSRFTKRSYIP